MKEWSLWNYASTEPSFILRYECIRSNIENRGMKIKMNDYVRGTLIAD